MLDYVCIKNSFIPQPTDQVKKICRGDERFILDDAFDDTMYCITDNRRIVSCSYYKPNSGKFENTCSKAGSHKDIKLNPRENAD